MMENESNLAQPEQPEKNPLRDRPLLEGFVAQVLNERELVINIGRDQGVRRGMRFRVLAQEGLEVRDPVSGASLGELERDKVRVEATEIKERMTVCRTYVSWVEGGQLNVVQNWLRESYGPARRVFETLRATEEAIPAPLSQEESYVRVGDRVRQLRPNEDNEIEDKP